MQTLQEALPSTLTPASSGEPAAVPETWVDRIFNVLGAQLGTKVADLWASSNPETVRREWAEALASFEPAEIKRGLTATRTRAFAPTLGEFLRLCRPALDPEIAWLEAQEGMKARELGHKGEWTHPGVYRAARDMAWEIKNGDFKAHRKRWEWRLERELQRGFLMGVPAPAMRLADNPSPGRRPTPEERERLTQLRNSIQAKAQEQANVDVP